MKIGVSVWNYIEPTVPLHELVEELVGFGFDAVSFMPKEILALDPPSRTLLWNVLDRHDLAVTVHGKFRISREEVSAIIAFFGHRLAAFTFDAARLDDAAGGGLDTARMAEVLTWVRDCSEGTSLRFAVEDFPLTAEILEEHRPALAPLLACDRFGILIDVGHAHLRCIHEELYRGVSVASCISGVPIPLVELHIHDNAGDRDSHSPFGFGTISFEAIAERLKQIQFEGITTIEIAPVYHDMSAAESKPHLRRTLDTWRHLCGHR